MPARSLGRPLDDRDDAGRARAFRDLSSCWGTPIPPTSRITRSLAGSHWRSLESRERDSEVNPNHRRPRRVGPPSRRGGRLRSCGETPSAAASSKGTRRRPRATAPRRSDCKGTVNPRSRSRRARRARPDDLHRPSSSPRGRRRSGRLSSCRMLVWRGHLTHRSALLSLASLPGRRVRFDVT